VISDAVILSGPSALSLGKVGLKAPMAGDVVVRVRYSGISTGTEKLFWQGTMPPFPGMGYPLVPGYESFGEARPAFPSAIMSSFPARTATRTACGVFLAARRVSW
jgi:2-desacetyl-2-hydroxyethyl bacteriochlorophyllide A dehydrogenase